MHLHIRAVAVAVLLLIAACKPQEPPAAAPAAERPAAATAPDANGFTAPSRQTAEQNAAVARALALADQQDFEDAKKGLVASEPKLVIPGPEGEPVWNMPSYDFVEGEAPPSVNPSLWRQAKLNGLHGLFRVAEGVYQVRGYDVSNMSWIRGKSGWIVVDPLTSKETAAAAIALARKHLGADPIVAVIFTHSHVDHFGGVAAILPTDEPTGAVRVVAPAGFVEEATSENLLAGTAMVRRGAYQFGMGLPRGVRGYVDTGLGKAPSRGSVGFRTPTDVIDRTPQPLEIDGVRFVFQYAPDSEAPAELAFYLPDHKAYCGAEIVSHTLHNLYTLRGAKVRDALKWSGYIDEAMRLFPDVEVVFASHHWPVWDNARVIAYLEGQRDTYKYIHDQTLRLANLGLTPREIAEQIELPPVLERQFANRGYYGTVRHNVKAVYQWYFGWYDANPANLDPLPPEDAGKRYVEAMGGAAEVKRKAREALARDDLRWAASMLDHLVFADGDDREARELLASVYDQLGYRAESGVWRSVYLMGAYELRRGVQSPEIKPSSATEILQHMPLENFFTAMATLVNGPKAHDKAVTLNFVFTDAGETHVLELKNSVLHHARRDADPKAAATVRLTRAFFRRLVLRQVGLREVIFSDELEVDGSRTELFSFFSLLDQPDGRFPIVTP